MPAPERILSMIALSEGCATTPKSRQGNFILEVDLTSNDGGPRRQRTTALFGPRSRRVLLYVATYFTKQPLLMCLIYLSIDKPPAWAQNRSKAIRARFRSNC
jgi:hypothetical protein